MVLSIVGRVVMVTQDSEAPRLFAMLLLKIRELALECEDAVLEVPEKGLLSQAMWILQEAKPAAIDLRY
jgi:hypothetical protein